MYIDIYINNHSTYQTKYMHDEQVGLFSVANMHTSITKGHSV